MKKQTTVMGIKMSKEIIKNGKIAIAGIIIGTTYKVAKEKGKREGMEIRVALEIIDHMRAIATEVKSKYGKESVEYKIASGIYGMKLEQMMEKLENGYKFKYQQEFKKYKEIILELTERDYYYIDEINTEVLIRTIDAMISI